MNRSLLSLCLFAAILLSGCGFTESKNAAEKIAAEFMDDRIANGGLGEASFYSPEFWKSASKGEYQNLVNIVSKANGDLTSYSTKTWHINHKRQTNKLSGAFVTMVFNTAYKTGSGTETIILHRKKKSDKFTILAHNVNTPEIRKLIQKGIEKATKPESVESEKE